MSHHMLFQVTSLELPGTFLYFELISIKTFETGITPLSRAFDNFSSKAHAPPQPLDRKEGDGSLCEREQFNGNS